MEPLIKDPQRNRQPPYKDTLLDPFPIEIHRSYIFNLRETDKLSTENKVTGPKFKGSTGNEAFIVVVYILGTRSTEIFTLPPHVPREFSFVRPLVIALVALQFLEVC